MLITFDVREQRNLDNRVRSKLASLLWTHLWIRLSYRTPSLSLHLLALPTLHQNCCHFANQPGMHLSQSLAGKVLSFLLGWSHALSPVVTLLGGRCGAIDARSRRRGSLNVRVVSKRIVLHQH